jgi:prophage maintenance system killer protein
MLRLRDVVAINQEFHNGRLYNRSSLGFAVDYSQRTTNWVKALAMVVRAILIDHVFEDGNKRTAAALILTETHLQGFDVDKNRVAKLIERALRRNVTNLKEFEEMIKDAIR